MKIRCLIVDDKPLAIDILAEYVGKIDFLELAGATTDPVAGLAIMREQPVDLVLLDIQMPELSGLQFMKIAGNQCLFILTTAYESYALEGYEHDVVDYLLKPVAFDRFYRAVTKALHLLQPATQLKAQNAPVPQQSAGYIFVKSEHRLIKVDLKDILYIEGMQNYLVLHTVKERIIHLQTFKKLEEQLPEIDFVRVHRSYIVALRHITAVERSRIFMGDVILNIGESYRDAFYSRIERH